MKDENREREDDAAATEDLEVAGDEAEEVAGGRKAGGIQEDAGLQRD
jgi:hypothetical protein